MILNENKKYDISVIIPIYNEQDNIEVLFNRLKEVFEKTKKNYEIVFVNDGSADNSSLMLSKLYEQNKSVVKVLNFSRNFGHQLALTAGLDYCSGCAAVIMDADMQDPPHLIKDFIEKWEEGYEVVYGLRKERKGETFFKKYTASLFYKILSVCTSINIPENVGDFYLLDRKVIEILKNLKENHRFMRGLVAWSGFKRIGVEYVREALRTVLQRYGHRQKNMAQSGVEFKGLYHALRLIYEANDLFDYGQLHIPFNNERMKMLLNIKTGNIDEQQLFDLIDNELESLFKREKTTISNRSMIEYRIGKLIYTLEGQRKIKYLLGGNV